MRISLIVAADQNGVIGKAGGIPWRIKDDLKLFKQLTMGHHLIQGRKTYESIGRPLPGRTMVIVTRNSDYQAPGCMVCQSVNAALEIAEQNGDNEAFIGGGAEIYQLALPKANRIYFTQVHTAVVGGDTFFTLPDRDAWQVIEESQYPANTENEFAFTFQVLERK